MPGKKNTPKRKMRPRSVIRRTTAILGSRIPRDPRQIPGCATSTMRIRFEIPYGEEVKTVTITYAMIKARIPVASLNSFFINKVESWGYICSAPVTWTLIQTGQTIIDAGDPTTRPQACFLLPDFLSGPHGASYNEVWGANFLTIQLPPAFPADSDATAYIDLLVTYIGPSQSILPPSITEPRDDFDNLSMNSRISSVPPVAPLRRR